MPPLSGAFDLFGSMQYYSFIPREGFFLRREIYEQIHTVFKGHAGRAPARFVADPEADYRLYGACYCNFYPHGDLPRRL